MSNSLSNNALEDISFFFRDIADALESLPENVLAQTSLNPNAAEQARQFADCCDLAAGAPLFIEVSYLAQFIRELTAHRSVSHDELADKIIDHLNIGLSKNRDTPASIQHHAENEALRLINLPPLQKPDLKNQIQEAIINAMHLATALVNRDAQPAAPGTRH